ncbi:unnamed protein product [Symbiodinium natans]|uniref:Uncharacterized protein n=1 Tax=Symbiodinium natans TaxID=878477 RepID=A0A812PHN8_9DINO|nr:unnamed protein product [Symbiodinium natans]
MEPLHASEGPVSPSRWRVLDAELHGAFFAMEARRQQRQAYGRHIARGVWSAISEVAMFLGFTLYGLAKVRSRLLGPPQENLRYLALPVVLTLGITGVSLNRSVSVRDNLPLLWGKTWIALLVVWELWLYEPASSVCPGQATDPTFFITTQEQIVLAVFLSLEAVTLAVWAVQKTYPYLATFCRTPLALRFFWRVRTSTCRGEGWFSYLPNGCCCSLRRKHFKYSGDQDYSQLPHGHGTWQDDSYHGEVYEGCWSRGRPFAPFISRCFGTGAISCGVKVGYGTVRAEEELSQVFCRPQRAIDGRFRFGSLGVECSASGGFMAHLPQRVVEQHACCDDAERLVADLRGSVPRPRLSEMDLLMGGDDTRSATASFCSDISDSQTAFVFVHGYNCPTDWACLRLAQLMTLGKFSPRFLPFVFSWPTGGIPSFFHVRRQMHQFAPDLAEFLSRLHQAGIQEFHVMAHSMGCELVCAALDELERLPGRGRPGTTGGTDDTPPVKIKTISFCNPSCPLNEFVEGSLARLTALCERLTLYVDREDTALWAGEVLGGRGRALGRWAHPLPSVFDPFLTPKIDVVDCTSMDANVNGIRHSYFDLNAHLVSDLHELVSKATPAARRRGLVRTAVSSRSNVFSFLAPPVFVNW